jgi:hypothetical protein
MLGCLLLDFFLNPASPIDPVLRKRMAVGSGTGADSYLNLSKNISEGQGSVPISNRGLAPNRRFLLSVRGRLSRILKENPYGTPWLRDRDGSKKTYPSSIEQDLCQTGSQAHVK